MARTTALVLIAAMLVAVVVVLSSAAPAAAAPRVVAFQVQDDRARNESYAGPDGHSPLDDVPVVPMVAATAGVLTVLSVVAWRREWI